MFPVLISFRFPEFLGEIGWIEIAATTMVVVALFLWRRTGPKFSYNSFGIWLMAYLILRGAVWQAGVGYHFKLHTYGVLIAAGFVVGIYLASRQARRENLNPNTVLDLSFWILIAAMVGSRIAFIIVNIDDYLDDPWLFFKIWQGGLVFYGGFIGSILVSWYYCRKYAVNFFRISDIMIPSVALGHFFGRLGCYSAGCCHGSATGIDSFGAVFTSTGTVVARSQLLGVHIHPTQLYEALGELTIFVILILMRKRKRHHGQLLVGWLLLYAPLRFINEMFRGDIDRGVYLGIDLFGDKTPELFSFSQIISLGLMGLGLFLWLFLRSNRYTKSENTESE